MITTKKGDAPMKRPITIALAFAVAIVLPVATATAGNGNGKSQGGKSLKGQAKSLTAKQCTAEMRGNSGAFEAAFGDQSGQHAMRNCKRETTSEVNGEFKNAAQECAAIRADFIEEFGAEEGALEFMKAFGTNLPKNEQAALNGKGFMRNAFGKCVSGIVRGAIEDDVDDFQTAAQQCRVERAADPDLFLETWGNNLTDAENNAQGGENSRGEERKAFGKCISSTARGLEQEVEAPTPEEEVAPAV
jgi:hypothetical protein